MTTPTADGMDGLTQRSLHRLLAEWSEADLITDDQASAIEVFHRENHADERSRGYSRMVAVVSTLGAVLVGAGILLVVASNWGDFEPLTRSLLSITTFVIIEAVGYAIRFRTVYRKTGDAVLFIGAVAFGGTIHLVAQAYSYPLDDPSLFLYWLIPVLPLAYVVRSRAIAALAILVTFGVVGYRLRDWIGAADPGLAVPATYLMLGAAVVTIGGLHRDIPSLRRLAPPWEWLGTVTIMSMLFVVSFRGWHDWSSGRWITEVSGSLLALIIICGVATAAGVVVRTALRRRFDREVALTASVAGLAIIASAALIVVPNTYSLLSYATFNFLLLAMVVALVVGGIATDRQSFVNIALAFFAVVVFARYVEIGAGMFGTGVSMIVGGLLLVVLGVGLEQFRRTLIARMTVGKEEA